MTALLHALEESDDLRRAPWRGSECPVAGHCYVASEAAYHLLGGKAAGYKPCFIRHEEAPHWFLLDPNGQVIDLTAAQFATPVPYDQGTPKGFLTREPSKRAATLIERVQKKNKLFLSAKDRRPRLLSRDTTTPRRGNQP